MQALIAQDRDAFYAAEIAARERSGYRPSAGSRLIVSGRPAFDRGFRRARSPRAAPHNQDVKILGPAEAPLAIVRGRHRFRLLIKSARGFDLSGYLREWLAAAPKPKKKARNLKVDIDPQSFL